MVIKSSPVAIGSRVPQCPTFLMPSWRRTSATTSCEVIPSALSTSRTPSGETANNGTNLLQNFLFHVGQVAFNPRARGKNVPAAAEFLADRAHVHSLVF